MRISDWSSDVCSSDLLLHDGEPVALFADSRLQPAQRAHRRTSFGWSAGPAVVGPQPLRQGLFPEPVSRQYRGDHRHIGGSANLWRDSPDAFLGPVDIRRPMAG